MSLVRKRVLIIAGVFKPEPVVSAGLLSDLADRLSDRYEVTVIRPHPSRPMGFEFPDYSYDGLPYKVVVCNSYVHPASKLKGRFRESISMGRWCARYIMAHHNEIDFIYLASWQLFGREIIARRALKYGIPYITPVQDIYPESILSKLPDISVVKFIVKRLLMPSDRFLLRHAERIHTISRTMAEYLSDTRKIPKDRFVIVRNWQDEDAFLAYKNSHPATAREGEFTFMYMGNVGKLAGIEVLFDAFKMADLNDARLVIAGSGPAKEDLMSLATTAYSGLKIIFMDVPNGTVPATQAMADILCLPVKRGYAMSSIPSKLPAYMFSAKPVLASVDNESDTAKCIRESSSGWVVDPENPKEIAHCMRAAYGMSDDALKEKGEKGLKYALKEFSKTKNLDALATACINIIERDSI